MGGAIEEHCSNSLFLYFGESLHVILLFFLLWRKEKGSSVLFLEALNLIS